MFAGYKTYSFAALIAIATFCLYMGWIDQAWYELALGLLGAGGLASLRAAK